MFRFQRTVGGEDEFRTAEYEAFLLRNKRHINEELDRFFHGVFFHDSILEEMDYQPLLRRLRLALSCPNFQSERKEPLSVRFLLRFEQIRKFQCDAAKTCSGNLRGSIFLHAEIGTLVSPRTGQSLIMDFLPDAYGADTSFQVGIVFDRFFCEPAEPLAFQVLRDAGRIVPCTP